MKVRQPPHWIEFTVNLDADPVEALPRPACVTLTAAAVGAPAGLDPASIEVRDLETGTVAACRWDDAEALPDPFPDLQGYWTHGIAPTEKVRVPGQGRLYNLAAPGRRGRLTFVHRTRPRPCAYRVRARARGPGEAYQAVPRPWIGDGDPLFVESGGLLGGLLHARPALVDLGQGGPDLLLGNILGHILHYPWQGGASTEPYGAGVFLQADGEMLDVGWYAAPHVCDWNGDGIPDLLVGEGGSVLYYQNVGNARSWQLEFRGPVEADGKPLAIPVECRSKYPFIKQEYIASPAACDWDGDGHLDLLVGGYLTGLVYLYRGVGRRPDGTPVLTEAGPLEADGEILDVGWAAAPAVADFAASGTPGLVVGMMDAPGLQYFANVGTRANPRLARRPLCLEGPDGGDLELGMGCPCAWNFRGDGRPDLVVGAGHAVHLLQSRGGPVLTFRSAGPWRQTWGPHLLWAADGFRDDRGPAFVTGNDGAALAVYRRDTATGTFRPEESLTSEGRPIYRSYPDRDPWNAPCLRDLDGDGVAELLLGDSVGSVWLHRRSGPDWDQGTQLCLEDGRPVKVGFGTEGEVRDWTGHVGDRSDPVGLDLDGDGVWDLLVGDALGRVTWFHNLGSSNRPTFAPGEVLFEGEGRVTIAAADWDADGTPEIWAAWSSGKVRRSRREAGVWKDRAIRVPWIPYPHPIILDLDGSGAPDLILTGSYGFVHLFRRAFVDYGYSEGRLVGLGQSEG
jgi:hypothetical protein